MDLLDSLFGGEPPALSLPSGAPTRAALAAADARALALSATLPPPRRKVLEGLGLLWHDHGEAAHAVAQLHEGLPDHDYLHAILHRREGDYPNADYWFRSAGRHPVLGRLAAAAEPLLAGSPLREVLIAGRAWSARAFTAEVRKAEGASREGALGDLLVRLQALEMRAFAEHLLSG
jgi:hypothetical protein